MSSEIIPIGMNGPFSDRLAQTLICSFPLTIARMIDPEVACTSVNDRPLASTRYHRSSAGTSGVEKSETLEALIPSGVELALALSSVEASLAEGVSTFT